MALSKYFLSKDIKKPVLWNLIFKISLIFKEVGFLYGKNYLKYSCIILILLIRTFHLYVAFLHGCLLLLLARSRILWSIIHNKADVFKYFDNHAISIVSKCFYSPKAKESKNVSWLKYITTLELSWDNHLKFIVINYLE